MKFCIVCDKPVGMSDGIVATGTGGLVHRQHRQEAVLMRERLALLRARVRKDLWDEFLKGWRA